MDGQTKSRRATPRSRLGCTACKLRRLKCGEELPKCVRCMKAGLDCTGRKPAPSGSSAFSTFALRPSSTTEGKLRKAPAKAPPIKEFFSGSKHDTTLVRQQSLTCFSCQIKRIVCDGAEPYCYQYTRWSQSGSHSSEIPSSRELAISPTFAAVYYQMAGDSNERQLVDYFRAEAVQDLCGYLNPSFWMDLVLPCTNDEAVVRYATSALSAFHQEYVTSGGNSPSTEEASKLSFNYQYSKGIQLLQGYMSSKVRPSNRMILVCCTIFVCIELAREQFQIAEKHTKAALRVLKDWRRDMHKQPPSNLNHRNIDDIIYFERIFGSLDALFSFPKGSEKPYLALVSNEVRTGHLSLIPTQFQGVEHARKSYNYLENWISQFMFSSLEYEYSHPRDIPIAIVHEHGFLQAEIDRFERPFAVVEQLQEPDISSMWTGQSRTLMSKIGYLSMKIRFKISTANFNVERPSYDLDEPFAKILAAADSLTAGLILQKPGRQKLHSHVFCMGFSGSLYLMAVLCHDELIRQRAIFLLQSWSDTNAVAALRRALMEAKPVNDGSPWTREQTERYRMVAFDKLKWGLPQRPAIMVPEGFARKARLWNMGGDLMGEAGHDRQRVVGRGGYDGAEDGDNRYY